MSQIKPLAPGLWTLPLPHSMYGLQMGTRTTIVQVASGIILIAPGALDAQLVAEIENLGPVVGLVAPNLEHCLHLEAAEKLFPEAQVFIAPGLESKFPPSSRRKVLGSSPPDLWKGTLEQLVMGGMPRLNEVVFFHPESRTAILTDLAFNFQNCQHWPTRLMLKLNGRLGTFGPSRLLRYVFVRHTEQFKKTIEVLLRWPSEMVSVAHGDILEKDGQESLRKSFAWLSL